MVYSEFWQLIDSFSFCRINFTQTNFFLLIGLLPQHRFVYCISCYFDSFCSFHKQKSLFLNINVTNIEANSNDLGLPWGWDKPRGFIVRPENSNNIFIPKVAVFFLGGGVDGLTSASIPRQLSSPQINNLKLDLMSELNHLY